MVTHNVSKGAMTWDIFTQGVIETAVFQRADGGGVICVRNLF